MQVHCCVMVILSTRCPPRVPSVTQRIGQAADLQGHPAPALVADRTGHLLAHGINVVHGLIVQRPAPICVEQALVAIVEISARKIKPKAISVCADLLVQRGENLLAEQHEEALYHAQAEHHLQKQRVSEA